MKSLSLTIKAGRGALESLQRDGFDASRIGTLAGASGGAKWLVLSQLDRAIIQTIVPQLQGPVHLIGTSIGCWRSACYGQRDPLSAIERFEEAYIEQAYSDEPDIHEITAKSREILSVVLGASGVDEILTNPLFRMHIMTVRARHLLASERKPALLAGLATAATFNVLSRRSLGLFFERALFFDPRDLPPCHDATGFPMQRYPLTSDNLMDAVVATGSIPLVLNGVANIPGARRGIYRDGGVIDYHLDLPQSATDKLTLFPHFFDRIVPGWFDKKLSWRKPHPQHVDRTILVSPSAEFVAGLPGGKIPDRTDFLTYPPAERIVVWRKTVAACERMAVDFNDIIATGRLGQLAKPL